MTGDNIERQTEALERIADALNVLAQIRIKEAEKVGEQEAYDTAKEYIESYYGNDGKWTPWVTRKRRGYNTCIKCNIGLPTPNDVHRYNDINGRPIVSPLCKACKDRLEDEFDDFEKG